MPLPPVPTPPPGGGHALAPSTTAGPLATGLTPAAFLLKLKLLQEGLNELQQQLSELVDEVSNSSGPAKP